MPFLQSLGRAQRHVEACAGQCAERTGRYEYALRSLHGIGYHARLGLPCRQNHRDTLGIVRDGTQPDRDHQTVPRDFDPPQVRGGRRLSLVIGGRQARCRMMIGSRHVKADMAVRPDAAEEETDPAQFPDAVFILVAPIIDAMQQGLLLPLRVVDRRPCP